MRAPVVNLVVVPGSGWQLLGSVEEQRVKGERRGVGRKAGWCRYVVYLSFKVYEKGVGSKGATILDTADNSVGVWCK